MSRAAPTMYATRAHGEAYLITDPLEWPEDGGDEQAFRDWVVEHVRDMGYLDRTLGVEDEERLRYSVDGVVIWLLRERVLVLGDDDLWRFHARREAG